jgi:ribonuclease D
MYVESLNTDVTIHYGDISGELHRLALHNTIGVDIETTGLDPKQDRICTVQIYLPNYGVEIVKVNDLILPTRLISLLEAKTSTKIFHYAIFDVSFLMWKYQCGLPQSIRDTRAAATLLDPNKEKFFNPTRNKYDHGLASLVYYYYGVTLDKSLSISDWSGDLSPEQLHYACSDVVYLPDLLRQITSELRPILREVAEDSYRWIPAKAYTKLYHLPDPTERV